MSNREMIDLVILIVLMLFSSACIVVLAVLRIGGKL